MGKRGELPEFEPRGLGRKNKSAETFPIKQCSHIEGGKLIALWRERKDGTKYRIPWIKGGVRCTETARYGKNCPAHTSRSPE